MKRRIIMAVALIAAFPHIHETGRCQDPKKAVTSVPSAQLKKMLDELNYDYKATQGRYVIKMGKPGEDSIKYDVLVESFSNGQVIVVSSNLFALEIPTGNPRSATAMLNRVNDWNTESALSRAMRRQTVNKGKDVYVPRLEVDLDCSIGVTSQDVNRLIQRFPTVLKEFELYVR
jgi:hypothetical protein